MADKDTTNYCCVCRSPTSREAGGWLVHVDLWVCSQRCWRRFLWRARERWGRWGIPAPIAGLLRKWRLAGLVEWLAAPTGSTRETRRGG
jgi:hypothetical protein